MQGKARLGLGAFVLDRRCGMQNSRVSAVGVKSFVFHGFGSWEFFLTAKQKCIARLSFLCLLTEK
jgi:hypothetical protein